MGIAMIKVSFNQLRFAVGAGLLALATAAAMAMPSFGEWSVPADIETLPGSSTDINTASIDGCASISPDGLTLAFNSFRTGNQQIYLATRTSTSEGFGEPVMLPAAINTQGIESCPTITQGKGLYFTRALGDPGDLFVSKLGPKGWSEAERLGPAVNDPNLVEESASFYVRERNSGPFRRSINLPQNIDASRMHASIEDGLLEITIGGAAAPGDIERITIERRGDDDSGVRVTRG